MNFTSTKSVKAHFVIFQISLAKAETAVFFFFPVKICMLDVSKLFLHNLITYIYGKKLNSSILQSGISQIEFQKMHQLCMIYLVFKKFFYYEFNFTATLLE